MTPVRRHAENLPIALRLRHYFLNLLMGAPLASNAQRERKLGPFTGLPVFGLDGLSSSAYGPEAALVVLGAAGAAYIQPITWIILALMAILYVSYRQTIGLTPTPLVRTSCQGEPRHQPGLASGRCPDD